MLHFQRVKKEKKKKEKYKNQTKAAFINNPKTDFLNKILFLFLRTKYIGFESE